MDNYSAGSLVGPDKKLQLQLIFIVFLNSIILNLINTQRHWKTSGYQLLLFIINRKMVQQKQKTEQKQKIFCNR